MTHLLARLSHRQQQTNHSHHNHHHNHGQVDTTLKQQQHDHNDDDAEPVASLPCCSTNPAADLERMQKMAQEIDTFQQTKQHEWDADAAHHKEHKHHDSCCEHGTCSRPETDEEVDDEDVDEEQIPVASTEQGSTADAEAEKHQREKHEHNMELLTTGINTAIAIGTLV